jgi:AraC-like DNA-binding protein
MHPTYFVRRFGKSFGISPLAYFNRMKIYQAMGLLSETQYSIEQISEDLGFSDSSYFARVFKKYTSTTPTEYRAAFKR